MTAATSPAGHLDRPPRKALHYVTWIAQVLLAAMFLMAGASKLGGAAQMVGLFDVIGIGQWFRYLTGTLEVGGAVLLLVPGLAGPGAALLAAVMVGAITTHLVVLHNSPAMPAALLAGLLFVAWSRRAQVAALWPRRKSHPWP